MAHSGIKDDPQVSYFGYFKRKFPLVIRLSLQEFFAIRIKYYNLGINNLFPSAKLTLSENRISLNPGKNHYLMGLGRNMAPY